MSPPALHPSARPSRFEQITSRQVVAGTLVILAVAVGFWLIYQMRVAVFSLFVAFVISVAVRPLVDWLHSRGLSRAGGILAIYLAGAALAGGLMWLLLPSLFDQGRLLALRIQEYYGGFLQTLRASSNILVGQLGVQLPADLTGLALAMPGQGEPLTLIAQAAVILEAVARRLFTAFGLFLLVFYWLLERERILKSGILLVAPERRESVREFYEASEAKVGAYLRGLMWLSLAVGILSLAAYSLIGLPAALLLAIIAGLTEVIPFVGPLLGALPAAIVALSVEPSLVIWVVLSAGAIQFIENAILVPRLMGRAVGVNPLVTLLAVAAFGAMFGIVGAFLAVPLAAIAQLLVERLLLHPDGLGQPVPDGRGRLTALRVEVQELMQDVRKHSRQKPEVPDNGSDHIEDSIEAVAQDLDSVLAQALQARRRLP
jgi:predicted PurR-regulated permease PerM